MESQKDEVGQKIVEELDEYNEIQNSYQWSHDNNFDHDLVVGVAKSLSAKEIVEMSQSESTKTNLTPEGESILQSGSHEVILYHHLPENKSRISKDQLLDFFDGNDKILNAALGKAMKSNWITIQKEGPKENPQTFVSRKVDSVEDVTADKLKIIKLGDLNQINNKDLDELKHRHLVAVVKVQLFKITKGSRFTFNWRQKPEAELTRDMLASGSWKTLDFRPYNFNACGISPSGGYLHPLLKVRKEFREIFLELGYEEMPTNNFVESSFWNFDALFQPQSHPARDAHDTFFLSDPAETVIIPTDFLQRVKKMHEVGGKGSIGWRYNWQESEARKNILRTHTTAVSTRMLYKLAQRPIFSPKKYFSIDRVYRNETLDQTHLAEFHQIEGLVADYDLTLAHLIGAIKQFFERYGIRNLKFKPAYNPYTEPSLEIFGYHPELQKWVEIGNSGMFRPEMLIPMGLPPNVRVIAWGLSLERPTMIKYHILNIRELLGHKVDINSIKTNPICRFEK